MAWPCAGGHCAVWCWFPWSGRVLWVWLLCVGCQSLFEGAGAGPQADMCGGGDGAGPLANAHGGWVGGGVALAHRRTGEMAVGPQANMHGGEGGGGGRVPTPWKNQGKQGIL